LRELVGRLSGQRIRDSTDILLIQEHPEVADAADSDGLDSGMGRHRSKGGHDHIGECEPPHAVGCRRGGESAQ
jgi:hypothetical protein